MTINLEGFRVGTVIVMGRTFGESSRGTGVLLSRKENASYVPGSIKTGTDEESGE